MDKTDGKLLAFNKRQVRLIERFEKLAAQMDRAHVTICVDEEYNEIMYVNTTHLVDNMVGSGESVATSLDIDTSDRRIFDVTGHAVRARFPFAFFCDSDLMGILKRDWKKTKKHEQETH